MSHSPQASRLPQLFQAARELAPSVQSPTLGDSPGPHPIDDEELLLDWSLGTLTPERLQRLLEHLAACSACRREIAAMVRLEILDLPEVDSNDQEASRSDQAAENQLGSRPSETDKHSPASLPPANHTQRNRTVTALFVALAASGLLMFIYNASSPRPRNAAGRIALAQQDLQLGRTERAFTRVEQLLVRPDRLSDPIRKDAVTLLETSGYELARCGLAQGDFARVTDVDTRVARHGVGSGRLTNLRIQAERGETAEQSLSHRMSLSRHYEYEPDGRQVSKSFSIRPVTDTDRRIEAELQAAIKTYPDDRDLRLNYGQFLLELRRFNLAEAEFAHLLSLDPQDALAHTGMGLAILQQAEGPNDHQTGSRALPHFQAATQLNPIDPVMKQNLTICENRLSLSDRL